MTKAVLHVDDDVWQTFKRKVFEEHGTLRVMSNKATRVLKDHLLRDLPTQLANLLPSPVPRPHGPADIPQNRPRAKGSSAKLLRAMRETRGP